MSHDMPFSRPPQLTLFFLILGLFHRINLQEDIYCGENNLGFYLPLL